MQELLDPYLDDDDGTPCWIAVADTLEFIQLARESEVSMQGELDGTRVRDDNGDYLESGARYIVVREDSRVTGDETVKRFRKGGSVMSRIQELRNLGFDKTVRTGVKRYYVSCSQCEALVINGLPTHERGCPNARKAVSDESDCDC